MSRLPRVYLAGKIASGDWRHALVGRHLRGADLSYDDQSRAVQPSKPLTFDGFEYAGPYFLGDDHSCFHGPHMHGFGALRTPACEPSNIHHADLGRALSDASGDSGYWQTRALVKRSCLAWIRSSDAVFAWIEQPDAYATLLEIGYATARGIPVFLSFNLMYEPPWGPDAPTSAWNDWWFAEQTATWCEYEPDARTGWTSFLNQWGKHGWSPDRRRLWVVEAR